MIDWRSRRQRARNMDREDVAVFAAAWYVLGMVLGGAVIAALMWGPQ